MDRKDFRELVYNGLLILDGATGTELAKRGMPAGVCPELWSIENPSAVKDLQQKYLEAGSDIIYTPTFGGNRCKLEEFGPKDAMTDKKLRKYHYMVGMEYFDEPSLLAEYPSYEEAVKAVDAKLASNKNGITKVFRVDVPGKKESVFGAAMKGSGEAKDMDDRFIMSEIDFRDLKSTAHLPYEVLVSGNKVYALYARFRIAINFPDLSMMGANSFMNIMGSPEAIRKALQKTVEN